jgi:putative hydrolase of the HAD superfamily
MASFQGIQAITFDVGGTLIHPWPSVGHVYSEVAARHGYRDLPVDTLNQQFAAAWAAKGAFNHSRAEWLALVKQTFAGMLADVAVEKFFDDLYAHFAKREAWQVFEDVQPALEHLRRSGLLLGVISNWDERLRPLLEELQLSQNFPVIVISNEVGAVKPDCAIFQRAVDLLGVPAGTILHVGDSFDEDVTGAERAGMSALLLDRKGKTDSARRRDPTLEAIPDLNCLLELLL